jgi:hypothetical protein
METEKKGINFLDYFFEKEMRISVEVCFKRWLVLKLKLKK